MKAHKIKRYNCISLSLYALATFIIIIPTLIVLISNRGFSASFSKATTSVAILFIEIGLFIKIVVKKRCGEPIAKNIGAIIGLLLVMIWGILK